MTLKKKINILTAALLGSAVLLMVFVNEPLFSEIKKSSQNLVSLKQDIILLEEKSENLEKFKTRYKKLKTDLEKINAVFINADLPVDFISFLEKTASDSQMSIKISTAFASEVDENGWRSIGFQITSAGSFPDFLKFLEKLESSIYLIEVQDLNISRLSESELKLKGFENLSLGDVRVNFSLKVHTK